MKRYLVPVLIILLSSSCTSHKRFLYFQNGQVDQQRRDEMITNQIEIRIQPDDMLAISVRSLDPDASAPFNLISTQSNVSLNSQPAITDYLVDANGNIDFPGLGSVHLAGKTVEEAKLELLHLLEPYLKDAIINMRFTNFKVTVLGQVNNPSSFAISGEKLTVTEALGLAGDINDFGNREDVLVIREQDGQRQFGHLNMLESTVFNSEYYYLRQNDIIYVAPTKSKAAAASFQPLGQIILPMLGLLVSLTTLIITFNRQ